MPAPRLTSLPRLNTHSLRATLCRTQVQPRRHISFRRPFHQPTTAAARQREQRRVTGERPCFAPPCQFYSRLPPPPPEFSPHSRRAACRLLLRRLPSRALMLRAAAPAAATPNPSAFTSLCGNDTPLPRPLPKEAKKEAAAIKRTRCSSGRLLASGIRC